VSIFFRFSASPFLRSCGVFLNAMPTGPGPRAVPTGERRPPEPIRTPTRPPRRLLFTAVGLLGTVVALGYFAVGSEGSPLSTDPITILAAKSKAKKKDTVAAIRPPAEPSIPPRQRVPEGRQRAADAAWGAAMGSLGAVISMTFAAVGAGYGMAKSALGVVSLVKLAPSTMFRGMAPVVMAELLAIYGFVSGLNILGGFEIDRYTSFSGYLDLGAGLAVGLSCLAAGLSIGAIAEANLRSYGLFVRHAETAAEAKKVKDSPAVGGLAAAGGANYGTEPEIKKDEPSAEDHRTAAGRTFTAMILMLIFAEGLGLYGMIVGLLMHNTARQGVPPPIIVPPVEWAAHLGVHRPERLLRGTTPVIMSELLAIYGFVVGLIIALGLDPARYTTFAGYLDFAAGCTVGLGCFASGLAIGTIGDAGNRVYAKEPRIFVAMVLMLIFSEALGLYGLIVSLSIHGIGVTGLC